MNENEKAITGGRSMKILNISRPALDERHNYYGGAMGDIAYSLLRSLTIHKDIEILTFVDSMNLSKLPKNLRILKGNSFEDVRRETINVLENENISVVTHFYFHEPEYNPVAEFVKKKGLPFVIGMCELPHPLLKDELSGLLKLPFVRTFGKNFILPKFKKTLEFCDMLIVVNEGAKEYYSHFIKEEKIRIIPYGVDLERFRYTPLPKDHKILMVSRLIKRRGLDYIVEAMPRIVKEFPDAELHFVGEGPRRDILRRRAEELGIGSKLIFHGNVSAGELVELYRNCYIFCHLSFADGWNQPALEAMATGRPVICTDAPHNSMVEDGKTAFLIPFGDVDTLAEKLIYLFENYKLAEEMGMEGRKKAEKEYDWDKIAEAYYAVFKEVIE
ncbi:MAG: hypothetical protein DRG59_12145 [Deltaproteobacteria bacterium]|nr:MAG: hypothetical protein DRG59_12145 [Deltaproteobacteria bacterium]